MQIRFAVAGLIGNVLFMVLYNGVVHLYGTVYAPSILYSIVYFFVIPISHVLSLGLVFGWPPSHGKYVSSLLSNYPIGVTAIALGATCTAYLDRMEFNERAEEFLQTYVRFLVFWPHVDNNTHDDEKGEFYSSLVVMVITSVWSYVLSVAVNTPSAKEKAILPVKKEL